MQGFCISDEPVGESLTGFFGVIVVALPGVEGWVLEGASEAKSDWPGERAVFDNGGEIVSSLLGGLAT